MIEIKKMKKNQKPLSQFPDLVSFQESSSLEPSGQFEYNFPFWSLESETFYKSNFKTIFFWQMAIWSSWSVCPTPLHRFWNGITFISHFNCYEVILMMINTLLKWWSCPNLGLSIIIPKYLPGDAGIWACSHLVGYKSAM